MSMLWTLVFPAVKWGGWPRASLRFCLAIRLLILSPGCCGLNTQRPSRDRSSYPARGWPARLYSHTSRIFIPSIGNPFYRENVWILEGFAFCVEIFLKYHWNVLQLPPTVLTGCHSPWKGPKCAPFKPVVCEPVEFLNEVDSPAPPTTYRTFSRHTDFVASNVTENSGHLNKFNSILLILAKAVCNCVSLLLIPHSPVRLPTRRLGGQGKTQT